METKKIEENLQKTSKEVSDKVEEKTQQLVNDGKKYAQQVTKKANAKIEDLQHMTQHYGENLCSYVKENPVKAMGLSVIIGAIFALLLKR